MTAQPEVPGAPAVYLYWQENARDFSEAPSDAKTQIQDNYCSTVEPYSPLSSPQPDLARKDVVRTLYVRLKILTADGVRYGEVALDEPEPYYTSAKVEGRTIQPDGAVVPFDGKVNRRLVSKTRDMARYRTEFQMPDVRPGSILEYRVTLTYPAYMPPVVEELPPHWFVQRDLFVRKADYYYVPHTSIRRAEWSNYGYTKTLPDGVAVVYNQTERSYTLHMESIPPVETEFAPPWRSLGYRVIFHHTCFPTVADFWTTHGKWWTSDVDHFVSASGLKSVAAELVSAGDSEQQKVDKLYAAVAGLRNLSFGQGDTFESDERAELKIGNAREVWARKQGSSQDLTMLFVGLARAAGLKAYVMAIPDRSHDIFDPAAVREEDINDYVTIVTVDGKEQFFDPGEPFCPAGQLSWKHSFAGGIRQTDGAPIFAQTPGGSFKQNQILRTAKLQVAKDGAVTGTVTLTMVGSPALDWRQRALANPANVNDDLAAELGAKLPAGFSVKTTKVSGLSEAATPLTVQMELIGSLPVGASGEIAVPASLFEARARPRFTADKRDIPVDRRYASVAQDVVALSLPAGLKVKTAPADAMVPLADSARLVIKHSAQESAFTTTRMLIQGKTFYAAADYPALKAFSAKLSAADADRIVLAAAP